MNSADFAEIVAVTREFIRGKVVPAENLIEENDEVPDDIRQTAKDMGLYGFAIPEQYGGLGLSMEEEVQLVFELGYTTPALRSIGGRLMPPPISILHLRLKARKLRIFLSIPAASLSRAIRTSTCATASAGTTLVRDPPLTIPTFTVKPFFRSVKPEILSIWRASSRIAFAPFSKSSPA